MTTCMREPGEHYSGWLRYAAGRNDADTWLRARVRVSICQWVTSWVGVLAAAAAQLPQALVEVLRAQLPQGVVKVLASAAAQLPQALAEVLREQPQGVVEVLPPQLPEAEGVVDSYVSARRNLCCFISCDFTASGDHPPA